MTGDDLREDVIVSLIGGIGCLDGDSYTRMLQMATGAEIREATFRLRSAALAGAQPIPDILELNLWSVAKLIMQGRCLEYVTEALPLWKSWPDKPMSDQLKIAPLETVAHIRDALVKAGFRDVELVLAPDVEDEPGE